MSEMCSLPALRGAPRWEAAPCECVDSDRQRVAVRTTCPELPKTVRRNNTRAQVRAKGRGSQRDWCERMSTCAANATGQRTTEAKSGAIVQAQVLAQDGVRARVADEACAQVIPAPPPAPPLVMRPWGRPWPERWSL